MRNLAAVVYWVLVMLLLSLILVSFGYGFLQALFMATLLLPGMCCASLLLESFSVAPRRRPVVVGALACGIVLLEWLLLFFSDTFVRETPGSAGFPAIFLNPLFILMLLAAFVAPERLLSRWLHGRLPHARSLSFISDRRKVTVELDRIVYVESNDDEVFVHAADGSIYRTRMRISQWENLLDDRFVRIHRAYLVHAGQVTEFTGSQLLVGGRQLPVSRSYRSDVASRFSSLDSASAAPAVDATKSSSAAAVSSGSSRKPM